MTSVKVKFSPSSVILKEGTVHYQIIHHCKVRHIRTGYKIEVKSEEINVKFIIIMLESHYYKDMVEREERHGKALPGAAHRSEPRDGRPERDAPLSHGTPETGRQTQRHHLSLAGRQNRKEHDESGQCRRQDSSERKTTKNAAAIYVRRRNIRSFHPGRRSPVRTEVFI